MNEHDKYGTFLKELLVRQDSGEFRALFNRIQQAEHDERCLGRAVRIMGFVALLSLAALGHLAVLLPEFFENSTHILIKMVGAFGLASSFCLLAFLGYWLWLRAVVRHVHEDGRRKVLRDQLLQSPGMIDSAKTSLLPEQGRLDPCGPVPIPAAVEPSQRKAV